MCGGEEEGKGSVRASEEEGEAAGRRCALQMEDCSGKGTGTAVAPELS